MMRQSASRILVLLTACVVASASVPVFAANEAFIDLLKVLRDNGTINQEAYELLRDSALAEGQESTAGQTKVVETHGQEQVKQQVASAGPEITTKGKLEIKDPDGDWKWRVGGRIQHDVTFVDSDGGVGGDSSQEFRRARLFMSGTAWKYWDFKLQIDFEDVDDSSQAIEDAYIAYTGFDPVKIYIGQRKQQFSLSQLTSSKYIPFIERSVPTVIFAGPAINIGDRAPGITVATSGDDLWTAAGGFYFRRQTDLDHPQEIDDGYGFTGRVTLSPVHEKAKAYHLGLSGGYKRTPNSGVIPRMRARPAVNLGPRIVDTDTPIESDNNFALAMEAAGVWGPLSLQGEYYLASLQDRGSLGPDYDIDGYYVFGSYFLTGESRNYNWKNGSFSSVKPHNPLFKGGYGAWEIGLRYSHTDMNDAGVLGDDGGVLTGALNWYVNRNIMFRANYVKVVNCDPCAWGVGDEKPGYFLFRSQIFW